MDFSFIENFFNPIIDPVLDPLVEPFLSKYPTQSFQTEQVVSIPFQRFDTGIFQDFAVSAPLVSVFNDPEPIQVSQPTVIPPPVQIIAPTPSMIESLQTQPVINNIYTTTNITNVTAQPIQNNDAQFTDLKNQILNNNSQTTNALTTLQQQNSISSQVLQNSLTQLSNVTSSNISNIQNANNSNTQNIQNLTANLSTTNNALLKASDNINALAIKDSQQNTAFTQQLNLFKGATDLLERKNADLTNQIQKISTAPSIVYQQNSATPAFVGPQTSSNTSGGVMALLIPVAVVLLLVAR